MSRIDDDKIVRDGSFVVDSLECSSLSVLLRTLRDASHMLEFRILTRIQLRVAVPKHTQIQP